MCVDSLHNVQEEPQFTSIRNSHFSSQDCQLLLVYMYVYFPFRLLLVDFDLKEDLIPSLQN